ncbi:MAG: hypothetical protein AAGF54_12475, partial [Pseudomonadota bacterium]
MNTSAENSHTRTVFYVSGFDPRGPSPYHSMLTKQFSDYCEEHGLEHETGKRKREVSGNHYWSMSARNGDTHVTNRVVFLDWGKIIRRFWVRNHLLAVFKGTWTYLKSLFFNTPWHALRVNWPIFLAMTGPLLQILVFVIPALLGVYCLVNIVTGFHLGYVVGLVSAILAFIYLNKKMAVFNAPWVARIIRFQYHVCRRKVLENSTLPQELADRILETVEETDVDEIAVIAHSIGTQMVIPIMECLLQSDSKALEEAISSQRLYLVTIGHSIPFTSRDGKYMNRALRNVGDSQIKWLDISAPTDPGCFPLVDPVKDQFGGKQRVHT